jgi:hypothetical protein
MIIPIKGEDIESIISRCKREWKNSGVIHYLYVKECFRTKRELEVEKRIYSKLRNLRKEV